MTSNVNWASETLQSPVVLYVPNAIKLCILRSQCVCVFRVALTINSNRFLNLHWPFLLILPWGNMLRFQTFRTPCGTSPTVNRYIFFLLPVDYNLNILLYRIDCNTTSAPRSLFMVSRRWVSWMSYALLKNRIWNLARAYNKGPV